MFIEYRPGEFIRAEEIKKIVVQDFHYNQAGPDRPAYDEWAVDLYGPVGYFHDGSYGESNYSYLARLYFENKSDRDQAVSCILAVGNSHTLSAFSLSSYMGIKRPKVGEVHERLTGWIY
jgi:hypothetical protein